MNIEPLRIKELLALLNRRFPGWTGFKDPRFVEEEIGYKQKTIAKARALLSSDELKSLLAKDEFDEFVSRLKTIGGDTNLLYLAAPMSGDLAVLHQSEANKPELCRAVFDLLHGPGPSHERLNRFSDFTKARGLPNKWTFPTYFLFICHPQSEMFVKPQTTKWFLQFIGAPPTFTSVPTPMTYVTIKQAAQLVADGLKEFGPQDMVDIQSLIWVCSRESRGSTEKLVTDGKRAEFEGLFAEFVSSYLSSADGKRHQLTYDQATKTGQRNFEAACAAADRQEDTTDLVLRTLLPYTDTSANREAGVWVHIAPVVQGDIRKWFEGAGWAKAADWPRIANAILGFFRRCDNEPDQLRAACAEFQASQQSKGFSAGMLSPMLHALRPEAFVLINQKPRKVINYLANASHGASLTDYPALNEAAQTVVSELADVMQGIVQIDLHPQDLFDIFCHWLVAVKGFDFDGNDAGAAPEGPGKGNPVFTATTFELLANLRANPTKKFCSAHEEEFEQHLKEPFRRLFTAVRAKLPESVCVVMETEKGLFSRIQKNDYGAGGTWDFYWGAFYPKGGKRTQDAQLWVSLDCEQLKAGFALGERGEAPGGRFLRNAKKYREELVSMMEPRLSDFGLCFGYREEPVRPPAQTFAEWLDHAKDYNFSLSLEVSKDQIIAASLDALSNQISRLFEALFPLVILTLTNEPLPDIEAFLKSGHSKPPEAKKGFWKISPGDGAWQWDDCREGGFIAIGWDELGDVSKLTPEAFKDRCSELLPQHPDWGQAGLDAVWKFSRIRAGDRVVANQGTSKVLGLGTVTGPYYFVDGVRHGHRLPVKWDDLSTRDINEGGWRRTLIQLDEAKFMELFALPGTNGNGGGDSNPEFPLNQCAEETGVQVDVLERWLRAINRKGQAVFYGPPGTGKTFLAQKLAQHLVGGGNGLCELVQLHPAYAYEDFMQGLRPRAVDGGLDYPLVPGRFLDFCQRAEKRAGVSVLIIDEINRASVARVFGELMYLLEYRADDGRGIPLAGGGSLRIPSKVRLIGTMNTADRSIALVDHALRRRFAFIRLQPDYKVLRHFHEQKQTNFPVDRLIEQLQSLNRLIDDPNCEVGISFFLRPALKDELQDIWLMEIEPYLEELFFDPAQKDKVAQFRWDKVRDSLGL